MQQADLSRVAPFYHRYIAQVTEPLKDAFQSHQSEPISFLNSIPEEKWGYRYAEGKWSIKELVQHLIDAERIFCYRALRFARKDETPLPGFEEEDYAKASNADRRSKQDLLAELETVLRSSAQLFSSFDEEALDRSGTANGSPLYVNGLGYILIGHVRHHLNIIRERYLAQ